MYHAVLNNDDELFSATMKVRGNNYMKNYIERYKHLVYHYVPPFLSIHNGEGITLDKYSLFSQFRIVEFFKEMSEWESVFWSIEDFNDNSINRNGLSFLIEVIKTNKWKEYNELKDKLVKSWEIKEYYINYKEGDRYKAIDNYKLLTTITRTEDNNK